MKCSLLQFKYFSFLLIFFISISINYDFIAQSSTNLNINDGLPSNTIRCFHRASNGILWIGTDAGLCSYDGRDFKVYDQTDGLASNQIYSIVEDNFNNLWIGCYNGGISYFNGSDFKSFTIENGLPTKKVRKLFFKDQLLFISSEDKLIIYDRNKFYYKDFIMQVMSVVETENSINVISQATGLYELSYDKDSLENFSLDSSGWFGSLYGGVNYNNGLLLFKNNELNHIRKDSNANKYLNKVINTNSLTTAASVVNDSIIYLAQGDITLNNGGLFRLHKNIVENVNDEFGVESNHILSFYYDNSNKILWVGTVDKGIYILLLNRTISFPIKLNKGELDYEKYGGIKDIDVDYNGDIWCITANSLFKYKNGKIKSFYSKKLFEDIIKSNQEWKNRIASSKINIDFVKKDLKNFKLYNMQIMNSSIWISSDHGIFKYEIKKNEWEYNLNDSQVFFVNTENELIIQHSHGFLKKHSDIFNEDNVYTFKKDGEDIPFDVSQIINYKNNIWCASKAKGLIKLLDSNFTFFNSTLNESNINHLTANDSILFLATQTGKVYGVEEKKDSLIVKFKLYPEKDIVGNYIYFIEYLNERLFVGTNKGLNIFDKNLNLKFFDSKEGYFHNEVLCSQIIDSLIYLSTKSGVIAIKSNPEYLTNSNTIKLSSLQTIDSLFLISDYNKGELELNYNRNYFTIKYDYPNLINSEKDLFKINFEYLNSNNNWVSKNNAYKDPGKFIIRFLNLSSGNYRISLSSLNKHNGKINKSRHFYFTITPPFWKTIPFYIIVFITTVLIIIFIVKRRIDQIKEKEKTNRRITEVRLEALKSQMNPHFTFNVMNSIQNYVIDNDIDSALYFIGSFSKLIRTTLDQSFKQSITLDEEIEFLSNYVEIQNMRFENDIAFVVDFPKKNSRSIKIAPMIIQPLIENIFVHAFNSTVKNPKLSLSFYLDEDFDKAEFINVVVSDNGLGRKKRDSEHISRGSQIIEERLSLLNNITSSSSQLKYKDLEKGTEVHLKMPIIYSNS